MSRQAILRHCEAKLTALNCQHDSSRLSLLAVHDARPCVRYGSRDGDARLAGHGTLMRKGLGQEELENGAHRPISGCFGRKVYSLLRLLKQSRRRVCRPSPFVILLRLARERDDARVGLWARRQRKADAGVSANGSRDMNYWTSSSV